MDSLEACMHEIAQLSVGDYLWVYYKNYLVKPNPWYEDDLDINKPIAVAARIVEIVPGKKENFFRKGSAPEVWVETIVPLDGKKRKLNVVTSKQFHTMISYRYPTKQSLIDRVTVKEYLIEEKKRREIECLRAEEDKKTRLEMERKRAEMNAGISDEELRKLADDI